MNKDYMGSSHTKFLEQRNLYYFALFVFMILGLYARFKGIATWPLSDDEYHTVASVNNLLKHGLPYFDCGGIYSRAIVYQYFLALLSKIFGGDEILIYRSANAVISLIALPAIYILTKKLAGKETAILALLFYLASIWEVEYARLIRMYMPFQVLFIWYLLYLYRVTIEKRLDKLNYLLVLSVVSVFIFEEGIFLTIINLAVLAFLGNSYYNDRKVRLFAILSITVSAISLLYLQINFTHFGIQDNLPADINTMSLTRATDTWGPVHLPKLLLPHLIHHMYWLLTWSLLGVSTVVGLLFMARYYRSWPIFFLFTFVAIFSALNQFTLALLSITVFYFLGWLTTQRSLKRIYLYIIIVLSAYGLLWITFTLNTDTLTTLYGPTTEIGLKKALVVLFKYPNFYDKIIYQWFGGMLTFSIISTVVISTGLTLDLVRKTNSNKFINQLFIIIILISTLVAISLQPYQSTRYTFLLYPIIIIMMVYYLHRIIGTLKLQNHKNSLLLTTALCLLYISDDHVFNYLTNIDTKEINYKIGFTPARKFHLRNRLDFLTPAQYINAHITPSDLVITTLRPVDYYLNNLDYYFITPEDREFKRVSACGGTKELWTNADLLYSDNMLIELVENRNNHIYLIMHSDEFPYPSSTEQLFHNKYKNKLAYLSIDRNVAVYEFNMR